MFRHSFARVICGLFIVLCLAVLAQAQKKRTEIPSPASVLGFQPTDDKTIADWSQITNYFQKLDQASDKIKVQEIGKSTLGKPLIVAFISSADNIKNLDKYRQINRKLANPKTVKDAAESENLIKQGKTIVSISCSIHSTEIVASQMSLNLAFELAVANDEDTRQILDNTILLLIPSPNPDGIDIVTNWYRKTLGTKYEGSAPPELYHHYAGHDDNRDWFMMNLKETQAITKFFWQEWFPEIVYDVHQQGQTSSRFIIPPFFDPVNPRIAPLILRQVGLIGYKMAADLQAENISGVATNSTYDTWWHGGFRSAPYYHNSIGILSEAASADLMSPVVITREQLQKNRAVRGLPSLLNTATNYPDVWTGGEWHPRDIARIEMIASRALLDLAAKFRAEYLRNFYDLARANLTPKTGEPQAFVVTAGQPNGETVARFLEILMQQGIEVFEMKNELHLAMSERNRTDFHEMPLGSFLIFVNQAQKNNVLSLFERQKYPERLNADGEAEVPYDVAGWTLPLQMGVEADAVWSIQDADFLESIEKLENINQARAVLNLQPGKEPFAKLPNPLKTNPKVGLYKGFTGSMDEGWTRFVLDTFQISFASVSDADLRGGKLDYDALILPADNENAVVKGLSAERYPAELAGGIGEAGVANLKKYVENGGKLICFDDSCEMVIKLFNLPMKDVLKDLKRSEFYDPGSVVKLEVDTKNPLAKGLKKATPAYFSNSSAFEISDESRVKTIVNYAAKDSLLSGWTLGEKCLNGKTALAETVYGKGKIVLFGFRPQHRGQSWATFPFIFNALEK